MSWINERFLFTVLLIFFGMIGGVNIFGKYLLVPPVQEQSEVIETITVTESESYTITKLNSSEVDREIEQFLLEPLELPDRLTHKSKQKIADLTALFKACCVIESRNNPRAVGDQGHAVGVVQIWKCVVDDVNNKILGRQAYSYEDRKSHAKSQEIFKLYLGYWGEKYEKTTGKRITAGELARIWNGGPEGWKKSKTKTYERKIKKVLGKV